MPQLTDIITIHKHETVTLVGSGGKSSLMWLLAETDRQLKTLVTTTTKISSCPKRQYEDFRDSRTLFSSPIKMGITLAGEKIPGDERKLGGLDPEILEKGRGLFDRILIEGDGSRTLPLKGWADYEPVVPWYTGCTIGVITLWPLGRQIDESIVLRLQMFSEITGAREGDVFTLNHALSVITHPQGLWKNSLGRRILFINQVEDSRSKECAEQLVEMITPDARECFFLIIAGSVRNNQGSVLACSPASKEHSRGIPFPFR